MDGHLTKTHGGKKGQIRPMTPFNRYFLERRRFSGQFRSTLLSLRCQTRFRKTHVRRGPNLFSLSRVSDFFLPLISWALLQANFCVLQLRGFCFPGSSPGSVGPSDLNARLPWSLALAYS